MHTLTQPLTHSSPALSFTHAHSPTRVYTRTYMTALSVHTYIHPTPHACSYTSRLTYMHTDTSILIFTGTVTHFHAITYTHVFCCLPTCTVTYLYTITCTYSHILPCYPTHIHISGTDTLTQVYAVPNKCTQTSTPTAPCCPSHIHSHHPIIPPYSHITIHFKTIPYTYTLSHVSPIPCTHALSAECHIHTLSPTRMPSSISALSSLHTHTHTHCHTHMLTLTHVSTLMTLVIVFMFAMPSLFPQDAELCSSIFQPWSPGWLGTHKVLQVTCAAPSSYGQGV